MEVEARPYLAAENRVGIYLVTATAQRISLFEEFQQITGVHHSAVGAEITGPVLVDTPCKEYPRI